MLAIRRLQDIESFSTMFLNYDLLAKRWVRYGYVYPHGELLAGVLTLSARRPAPADARRARLSPSARA